LKSISSLPSSSSMRSTALSSSVSDVQPHVRMSSSISLRSIVPSPPVSKMSKIFRHSRRSRSSSTDTPEPPSEPSASLPPSSAQPDAFSDPPPALEAPSASASVGDGVASARPDRSTAFGPASPLASGVGAVGRDARPDAVDAADGRPRACGSRRAGERVAPPVAADAPKRRRGGARKARNRWFGVTS
jgi:hypothetical protein